MTGLARCWGHISHRLTPKVSMAQKMNPRECKTSGHCRFRGLFWDFAFRDPSQEIQFLSPVEQAEAGECCLTAYDTFNVYYGEQWCPDFCCQDYNGRLYCCSEPWRRAPDRYRYGYCSAWWTYRHNMWAFIYLMAMATLARISSFILLMEVTYETVCFLSVFQTPFEREGSKFSPFRGDPNW